MIPSFKQQHESVRCSHSGCQSWWETSLRTEAASQQPINQITFGPVHIGNKSRFTSRRAAFVGGPSRTGAVHAAEAQFYGLRSLSKTCRNDLNHWYLLVCKWTLFYWKWRFLYTQVSEIACDCKHLRIQIWFLWLSLWVQVGKTEMGN